MAKWKKQSVTFKSWPIWHLIENNKSVAALQVSAHSGAWWYWIDGETDGWNKGPDALGSMTLEEAKAWVLARWRMG